MVPFRVRLKGRPAALFAGLFAAGLAGASAAPDSPASRDKAARGVPVDVAQASADCFSEAIHAGGYLQPRVDAVVVITLEGYQVAEVLAAAGDVVSEAQPLARLQRIEGPSPYPPGMGPPAAPGAALPASIVLRAPAGGSIVESRARLGVTASAQEPLFRIAVDGMIEALAQVPSIHIREVKPDQEASVTLEDGREFPGRVRRIGAQIDPQTQMGEVRIAIERDPALRSGRLIRARINARHSCGLAIPRSALFYTNEGASVQIVRGRVVETARVRLGLTSGALAEIAEGLRAGDLVVLNAGGSLHDGDVVSPILSENQADERSDPPAPADNSAPAGERR